VNKSRGFSTRRFFLLVGYLISSITFRRADCQHQLVVLVVVRFIHRRRNIRISLESDALPFFKKFLTIFLAFFNYLASNMNFWQTSGVP